MNSKVTHNLHNRAHNLIPAGAHTYSRADDQFPSNAPLLVKSAKGAYFYDERGRQYLDYGMGILSVSIGHAEEEINQKVRETIDKGTSFSRPSVMEGELAERLNEIIPSAEMVKFAKNGSDVTSAAIRLARAYTGRKIVVRCRQQPFLSFDDWFIVSTSRPAGIPLEMKNWVKGFDYNDLPSLEKIFYENKEQIACVIMEPFTYELPEEGFLQSVKSLCEKEGALLIFDEIITGFRTDFKGAQYSYNVTPHLSTFGKGIANGYPMAVLCGRKEIMELGGMQKEVFLLSCTFGGELVGISAALATIDFMDKNKVPKHLAVFGDALMRNLESLVSIHHLNSCIKISGHPARPELRFLKDGKPWFGLKTLFMQKMMEHQILMERIALSFSHREPELKITLDAFNEVIPSLASCIEQNSVESDLEGPEVKPVFTF